MIVKQGSNAAVLQLLSSSASVHVILRPRAVSTGTCYGLFLGMLRPSADCCALQPEDPVPCNT